MADYTNDGSGTTWHALIALATGFDAVRVLFANHQTSGTIAIAAAKASVVADASTDDAINNSSGTWSPLLFGGSGSVTMSNSASVNRVAYQWSDWLNLSSVARTDGGLLPLLAVRAHFASTVSQFSVWGNGADSFTNWATRTDGRIWINRMKTGNQVSTVTGFDSSTNISQSPILGVQYAGRGRVITVMGLGDSITDGRGSYLGEGFGVPMVNTLSAQLAVPMEWANMGWAGQNPVHFSIRVGDVLQSSGLAPDILMMAPYSPNVGSAPLTTTMIDNCRQAFARALRECYLTGVVPVFWTGLPTSAAVKNWDASDNLRRAYNYELLGYANNGVPAVDFDGAFWGGGMDQDGQNVPPSIYSTDGIHPNNAGNSVMAALGVNELGPIIATSL